MSRRSTEAGVLKGVGTFRNGVNYAISLPKFTPPPNAASINPNLDDVHERFRKLTPKQRIAVLTLRDRNIVAKLYTTSNALWYKQMNQMRKTVGQLPDDDHKMRQFCNSFEYLFGAELSGDDDSDHEGEGAVSIKKPLLKKTSSITSSVVRPMNSTFSFSHADPTLFKPKLNFISTKDALGVLIDGAQDFLQSKARARCRILQKPEMWDRIIAKECETFAEYESMIYQLMEFRVLFEYLNFGGEEGEPFARVRKAHPSCEEQWAKQEQGLINMEQGGQGEEVNVVIAKPAPKKTRKKRLLEKIASSVSEQPIAQPQSVASEPSDTDEMMVVVSPAPVNLPAPLQLQIDESDDFDDWIQVGKRKSSADQTRKAPAALPRVPGEWKRSDPVVYVWGNLKAEMRRTFIQVKSYPSNSVKFVQESPF